MTLVDIQDYLCLLLDSFASLLDLELTVMSGDPITRVAGTGLYRNEKAYFNLNTWQNSYAYRVIETGQPVIAIDTSEYMNCISQADRERFGDYYSVLAHPISHRGQTIGGIFVASFTAQQQALLIAKKDSLLNYLSYTAELITLKLEQEEKQEEMETAYRQLRLISETVESGMLLYSDTGVDWMNERAKQLLFVGDPSSFKKILADISEFARLADQRREKLSREYYHTSNGHSSFFTLKTLPLNNAKHNVLCIITPFVQIQETILQNARGEIDGDEVIAASKEMRQLLDSVKVVSQHNSNVLIQGESGTGKEMIARMIHSCSNRKNGPFVSINCAAIPESLLESELFGYEEGSFTGARKGGRIGKFMLANNGTLFLDEIGDMPLYLQAKLLRVLSERKVDPIGGMFPVDVNVRIVSATNQFLEEMVANRRFREDLYYRLNVIPLKILPLRQRKADIIPLAKHFVKKYNEKLGKYVEGLTSDVLNILLNYNWPGNVRELENCLEYMMNFEQDTYLSLKSMPPKLLTPDVSFDPSPLFSQPSASHELRPLKEMLWLYEQNIFQEFLTEHHGKPSLAEIDAFCKTLNISRASYYRKTRSSQQ